MTGDRVAAVDHAGRYRRWARYRRLCRVGDLAPIGSLANLYDPVWFPEKVIAAFAAAAATAAALTGTVIIGWARWGPPGARSDQQSSNQTTSATDPTGGILS